MAFRRVLRGSGSSGRRRSSDELHTNDSVACRSTSSSRCSPPRSRRSSLAARAVSFDALPASFIEEALLHAQLQGALHISAAQLDSCMLDGFRTSDLGLPRQAPPLAHLHAALESADDAELIEKAVCLATPPDAEEEAEHMTQVRLAVRSTSPGAEAALSRSSRDGAGCGAHQRGVAGTLQGSADSMRRRKRAMVQAVRVVRQLRATAQSLCEAITGSQVAAAADAGADCLLRNILLARPGGARAAPTQPKQQPAQLTQPGGALGCEA